MSPTCQEAAVIAITLHVAPLLFASFCTGRLQAAQLYLQAEFDARSPQPIARFVRN